MRGMGDYPSATAAAAYWSYMADKRFEPMRTTTITTTTATAIKANNPNLVYRARNYSSSSSAVASSSSFPPPSSSSSYTYSKYDKKSETKRKRRIMSYKAYVVEGKVKASIRNTFRFIKNKYSSIVRGC